MNESATIDRVIDAVLAVPLSLEIVVVDDGSTDQTWSRIEARLHDPRVRGHRHDANRGKGSAIRTALEDARGDFVVIQDADLEYEPSELVRLVAPIEEGRASIVYGTRSFSSHTAYSFWYVVGNRLVNLAANVLYNVYLSDLETGYKLLPASLARSFRLQSHGFEIEAEITSKILRSGHRIYEVPISYTARSRAEGKKLTAADGLKALATLARFRSWRPSSPVAAHPESH